MTSINFCSTCGENLGHLEDTAVFCTKCGTRIKKENASFIDEKTDNKKSADSANAEDINVPRKNQYEAWVVIIMVFAIIGVLYYISESPRRKKPKSLNNKDFSIVAPASTAGIKLIKVNVQYDQYTDMHTIHCKIENNTGRLISYMDLKGVFYDKKGNIIGTGIGAETNFPNGYSKIVDIVAIGIVNPKNYEVQIGNVIYE